MKIYTGIGKKSQKRSIMKTYKDYDIDLEDDSYDEEEWDDEIYND